MRWGYVVMSGHFKEGGIRMMGGVQIDLEKVFKILEEASYEHDEDLVFDACFKNFDPALGLTQEGVIAQMIRLALLNVVSEAVRSLADGEEDVRDVLVLLIVAGLGLRGLSHVIEMAEKGLRDLYDEREINVVVSCIEKLFKIVLSKMGSYVKDREVILQ